MTNQSRTRTFIFLALVASAVHSLDLSVHASQPTGNELGVDLCSHKHFLIVDGFVEHVLLKNLGHADLSYHFTKCAKEAPVGSAFREYRFEIAIGAVTCPFTFRVEDVRAEVTLTQFSPQEVQDFNDCKTLLEVAYPAPHVALPNLDTPSEQTKHNYSLVIAELKQKVQQIDAQANEDEEQPDTTNTGAPVIEEQKIEEAPIASVEILPAEEIKTAFDTVIEQLKERFEDKDEQVEAYIPRYDPNDERPINGAVAGGWNECKGDETLGMVLHALGKLRAARVAKAIFTYVENITSCKYQIVNGINYKINLSYDDETCPLAFYENGKGEVTISEGFQTTADCAAFFTRSFRNAHPSLIADAKPVDV